MDESLYAVSKTLFDAVTGLKVRPRFCRAEGPSGLHRSPQRGETVEFSEYRPYVPGSELRFLDWKLYARCDRLYVKSFCDERASRFFLIVDDSASMVYPLEGRTKLHLSAELALGLAYLAGHRQKDAVSVLPLSEVGRRRQDDIQSIGAILLELQKLISHIEQKKPRPPADPSLADRLAKLDLRYPTTVILISDCYENPSDLMELSRRSRRNGHEFWLLQVLSREEIALPCEQAKDFVDLESGLRLQLDPRAIHSHYHRAIHDHIRSLKSLTALGRFSLAILGQDPVDVLKHFLHD